MSQELKVDPERVQHADATGIYVRAQYGERWTSADIATLDRASLLAWLRGTGGANPLAENVVGVLLGHGHLHDSESTKAS